MNNDLTHVRLRELLLYDPETGVFTWRANRRRVKAGDVAGYVDPRGYIQIGIDGSLHRANRLAWLYMTGEWPAGDVDHRDTDGANNRWLNLRDVSRSVNMQNRRRANTNNKTGLLGVSSIRNRFHATIWLGKKQRLLGAFDTAEEAHATYVEAKRRLHAGCTI